MFIIFDLDDTLIDSSGSIIPFQLKRALKLAVRVELPMEDFSSLFSELMEVNRVASSGEVALRNFLNSYGVSKDLTEQCVEVLGSMPDPELAIEPVEHAKEVLEMLGHHQVAIVTIGKEELQLYKLKKAGFDPRFFSKIIVAAEKNKKAHYIALLDEFKQNPSETIVIGDRVVVDLAPAKALGCQTVQILRGRGLAELESGVSEDVDHRIHDLSALVDIVDRQKVRSKR
ncbi:MAG: HAD family hydrolase [Simkania sp.]|nr:HAD family hydrolase [Simkania sp.]